MFNRYAAYNTGNSEILTSDRPDNVWDTFVHLCVNMQGLAPVGWKSCSGGLQYIFYLFLRYRLFTLRPGWRFLVGYHLFQIPRKCSSNMSLWRQLYPVSPSRWYDTDLVFSFQCCPYYDLYINSMWQLGVFCKADVPDDGLSSYAAKKKRINVGKGTLSAIVIYRHE